LIDVSDYESVPLNLPRIKNRFVLFR